MQQEVALLLITVITTETACQQLVAADGVRPLLALLAGGSELPNMAQTRSCALHLISRICAHNGAPALLAAGAAVPVMREMMRAAMIANWTGSADAVDSRAAAEASKDAGQALSALAAFGAIGDSGVEAVRHAVRQASALPALVALLACRQEEVHKAAATILALLDPTDKMQLTELENSGGITLLCETLVSTSAAGATHLQAMQTLATLSAAPTSAVAIAEYPRALATCVNIIVAPPTETAKAAALTTLANLSSLGALSLEPLRSQPFLSALAAVTLAAVTMGSRGRPHTEARTAALGLLAKVSEDRVCRRELVLLNLPPAFSMAIGEGGEGARHATHALSHFAADETFRLQLASWGALSPLAQQLSATTQPDARTRAMALSALANYSYVDPTALSIVPGVLATLGRLLFEQDAAVLTMALTALSNLVGVAETVAPALLAAGTPQAVHALLSHADHHVVEQALTTLLKLSGERALAGAFAEVPGAITSVVFLIGASEPNGAVPLAAALGAMLESWPEARGAALEAGGAAALGTALLGCTEADGRLALALTLAAVVHGDWDAVYAACGWPAVLAVLNVHVAAKAAAAQKGMMDAFLASNPRSEALHKASAEGTAALLARQGAAREALSADPTALRFVAHTLGACMSDEAVADGTFALGTAYAIVLLLGCAASRKYVGTEYAAEGLHATRQLATNPKLAGALAQAGAVPLLVLHMSASEPNGAVPLAAALGAMLESWPEARGAALEAGGAAALGTALLGCTEADGRTVLALTLAAVVRGDVGAAQAACGWQGIVAVLVAAAATVSTPLRELAAAVEPGLTAAVAGASPKAPGTAQPAAAPAAGEAVTKPKSLVGPQAVHMYAYDDDKPQVVRTSLKSRPAATDLD